MRLESKPLRMAQRLALFAVPASEATTAAARRPSRRALSTAVAIDLASAEAADLIVLAAARSAAGLARRIGASEQRADAGTCEVKHLARQAVSSSLVLDVNRPLRTKEIDGFGIHVEGRPRD